MISTVKKMSCPKKAVMEFPGDCAPPISASNAEDGLDDGKEMRWFVQYLIQSV
jgi:hypothetical protein